MSLASGLAQVMDDRRYTDQHEWALVQGSEGGATVVRVGITDHAQDALGDIVFVQLPEVGDEVGPGAPIGEVETNFAHCWSEATWACQGPASPDCAATGDAPSSASLRCA